MEVELLVARVVLAAVLFAAGFAKLADRGGSLRAVADFGVPSRLTGLAATTLPLVELAIAVMLLVPATALAGAWAAFVLFACFAVAIAVNLVRGRTPDCHCFGRLHSAPVSWLTVARNVVLALVALVVVWGSAPVGVLPAALAAALGIAAIEWRRSRREPSPGGLSVGSGAPEFHLRALNGGTVTLAQLRGRGKPVLLVFADVQCGPCIALAPEIARWQREQAEMLTVAVIERGHDPSLLAADEHGRVDVLLQADEEVSGVYGVAGTPGAVLVDPAGRVASELASGAEAIRRLATGEADGAEAAHPERYEPLGRRDFLFRLAGVIASTSVVLTWPASALASPAGSRSSVACGPGRKACGKRCCRSGQKCVLRAFGRPKCVCDDSFFRDPCGDDCVNTTLDSSNCGGCGVECLPGRSCAGGECPPTNDSECPGGCSGRDDTASWCCQGECKNLINDRDNCGACGRRCTEGKNPTCCEGLCRDIQTDPRHCGGCFKPCSTEGICHAGKCRDECPKPLKRCGQTCYRPQAERCCNGRPVARDGLCGDGCNVCKEGETCENGKCVRAGGCVSCDETPQGSFDVICCDGDCVPSRIDSKNCGGCGRKCTSPDERASCGCSGGECYTVTGAAGVAPCVPSRALTRSELRRRRWGRASP